MNENPTIAWVAAFMLMTLLVAASTGAKKMIADKKTSAVTYTMHHPLHTWDGVSRDVNGAILYNEESKAVESVAIAIKVASFDSKDSNRDSHALEVLDGIKYPNVTFVSQAVQLKQDGTLTAAGKLTFHGVTKPVTLTGTWKNADSGLLVNGNFDIKMTDFGVEQPSLLGMKADDIIKMVFSANFR